MVKSAHPTVNMSFLQKDQEYMLVEIGVVGRTGDATVSDKIADKRTARGI